MIDWRNLLERARHFIDLTPDRESEEQVVSEISRGAVFRGANVWVLVCAIFIASLGLNVNSAAVIIGAMLISPLMGPIIGMGLAVGTYDMDLLRRSFKNYAVATAVSVATATVYFLFSPFKDVQSELLARTSPTLYDVLIAFFGGAAGIVALCTKGKGNVIPGVAIATALMPPLCTAGFGLATGRLLFFLGAFYLFFINTVFIALATVLGVHLMKFHRHNFLSPYQAARAKKGLAAFVVLTMLPAAVMTWSIVSNSIFRHKVDSFVAAQLQQVGTQILQTEADRDARRLDIVAIGREISDSTQAVARKQMAQYGLEDYELRVIQGEQTDSLRYLNSQLSQSRSTGEADRQKLLELSAENAELARVLNSYQRYDLLTPQLMEELLTLFPNVRTVGLATTAESSRDTTVLVHYTSAIVGTDDDHRLTQADRQRLAQWLKVRIHADSLVVVCK